MSRNYRTPYVSNWTLGIQHAFSGKLSLDVAYVRNDGTKLAGLRDINQINPQSAAEIACGHCEANSNRPFAAQFPYLEFINYYSNRYLSSYNGLQAALTARNYHGLAFLLGYTYSQALDDISDNWNKYQPKNIAIPPHDTRTSHFSHN